MPDTSQVIERHKIFTEQKIKQLQKSLGSIGIKDWSLIANGSYARREATPNSDFDYFILHKSTISAADLDRVQAQVKEIVLKVIGRMPAVDGAFGAALELGSLTKNIGGTSDTNQNITRRILFLTEGLAINNIELYDEQRDSLIARYVGDEISDHQLGMFLLNDLIRYYRTVCVDFEFKTFEGKKTWGLRNIKLIFSRKLLYVSGVLIAAEMAQRTAIQKREIARELTALAPIERLKTVCRSSADRAIEEYAKFLAAVEQKEIREMLEQVSNDRNSHTEKFKRLKNQGHHFSFHLMSAIKGTYSESHPIHRALIM